MQMFYIKLAKWYFLISNMNVTRSFIRREVFCTITMNVRYLDPLIDSYIYIIFVIKDVHLYN